MTIPIGFVMGFYLQKFRPGAVAEVSFLGVALLIIAVLLGRRGTVFVCVLVRVRAIDIGLAAGRLRLSRLSVTRLDALGASRVPVDL
jgi:carbon starvation protein CstA